MAYSTSSLSKGSISSSTTTTCFREVWAAKARGSRSSRPPGWPSSPG
jgi:hypothetical protein